MNKNILAAVIFGSLSAITLPAQAKDINQTAQSYIDSFSENKCSVDITESKECDLNEALIAAISQFPIFAESLLAAAIKVVGANTEAAETLVASAIFALGVDSPLIANILKVATEAGVDGDTLTAIAIASGVDATIASEATAAGNPGNDNVIAGNTGNNTGNTGNTNRGNAGGGGGGGGISDNQ
ncbi:MAG: hypothetical protein HRT50_14800 [Colwellia sp.]|uniref:hypothetical protein n=1 Tax=Colwellia sp. TaxID=56799 RepID=UPI001D9752E3|nr:hypothetical protein [Colwellia sp.]NQY50341.1 hypothetical protein [Colwellia sp.]